MVIQEAAIPAFQSKVLQAMVLCMTLGLSGNIWVLIYGRED